MKKKKIMILILIFTIVLTSLSGTFAYLRWQSTEETEVVFTVEKDFSCSANGGGDITSNDVTLAPAICTNSQYAIQRTVTVTPTLNRDEMTLATDLWLNVNSLGTGLSESTNFKYALTTSSTSCTSNVLAYGNFNGLEAGDKVNLLNKWEYTTSEPQTYYLYIWLHYAEKDSSTMNQPFNLSLGGECTNEIQPEAYAVYSADDSSLRFYKTLDTITEREEYNNLTATAVYTGIENSTQSSSAPWDEYKENITEVSFEDVISPISTYRWFYNFENLANIDLSNLDTSNVTNMSQMFRFAGNNATTWNIGNLDNWDTSNVTNMSHMFANAGYNATTFDIGDLDNWDTSNVTNMSGMFDRAGYSATTWNIGDLSNWDTSNVTNITYMFNLAGYNATTWNIGNLDNWDTSNVTNMLQLFYQAGHNATTFDIGDLDNWDTSNVTNMSHMFREAGYNATTWNIGDLSNWDTSNVTNMSHMFYHAGNNATTWNIGDLSNWDTSNVTNMSYMFANAGYKATNSWSLDLRGWNVNKVTSYDSFNNAVSSKITSPVWVN